MPKKLIQSEQSPFYLSGSRGYLTGLTEEQKSKKFQQLNNNPITAFYEDKKESNVVQIQGRILRDSIDPEMGFKIFQLTAFTQEQETEYQKLAEDIVSELIYMLPFEQNKALDEYKPASAATDCNRKSSEEPKGLPVRKKRCFTMDPEPEISKVIGDLLDLSQYLNAEEIQDLKSMKKLSATDQISKSDQLIAMANNIYYRIHVRCLSFEQYNTIESRINIILNRLALDECKPANAATACNRKRKSSEEPKGSPLRKKRCITTYPEPEISNHSQFGSSFQNPVPQAQGSEIACNQIHTVAQQAIVQQEQSRKEKL